MHQGCRVLVVDDDQTIRETIASLLADEGAHVVQARNGQEALFELRRQPFDLVLIDLMMPIMNGWQLIEAIQRDPALASVPCCVISANPQKAPATATRVLSKPLKIDQIFDVVDNYC